MKVPHSRKKPFSDIDFSRTRNSFVFVLGCINIDGVLGVESGW